MSGATELRDGNFGTAVTAASMSMLNQLTAEQLFDSCALRVDGPRACDLDVAVDISFADLAANYRLRLRYRVVVPRTAAPGAATPKGTCDLDSKVRQRPV